MIDGDRLAERVRALVKGPRVTEKPMFGGICFLYDGNMMLGASKRGLLVRVGKSDHESALTRPGTKPMTQANRTIPGYIVVGEEGLAGEASLQSWVALAVAHAVTLPAKAGKEKAPRSSRKPPAGQRV